MATQHYIETGMMRIGECYTSRLAGTPIFQPIYGDTTPYMRDEEMEFAPVEYVATGFGYDTYRTQDGDTLRLSHDTGIAEAAR